MLREFQSTFRKAMLSDRNTDALTFIRPTKASDAEFRFGIYRNNVRASLIEVLRSAFPAVNYFAGNDNFAYAASRFLEVAPPRIPRLYAYGNQFPKFLQDFAPAQAMPWLADLAGLEWACQESLFAADAVPLRIENISQLNDAALVQLALVPSLRVVASSYPVLSLWEQAQERFDINSYSLPNLGPSPNLAKPGETILLVRSQDDVEFHRLLPGEAALITAVQEGADLAGALEATLTAQPGQDLGYILAVLVARNCFTSHDVSKS